jgi:hypothetical protein
MQPQKIDTGTALALELWLIPPKHTITDILTV